MKTSLLLLLLNFSSVFNGITAQYSDEIIVQKKGFGFAYYQTGSQLSKEQLLHILDQHPEARKELQKGHRNSLPASMLTYAVGLLITCPMSRQLATNLTGWSQVRAQAC